VLKRDRRAGALRNQVALKLGERREDVTYILPSFDTSAMLI
jgi:hypothetical protein